MAWSMTLNQAQASFWVVRLHQTSRGPVDVPLSQLGPTLSINSPMTSPPIRVLIAKPGLDGHDRGAKVVVKALRDAGMEVIYTGRHQKVASIARIASDEGRGCRRFIRALRGA